jgi:type VI secretion system Hcp family effector
LVYFSLTQKQLFMQTLSFFSVFLSGTMLLGMGPATGSRKAGIGGEVAGIMKVESAKQGKIIGVAGAGKPAGGVNVLGFKMGQESPEDPGSGNTPGVRKHHFVVVTKAVDATSPEFLQAFNGKEVLKSVVIQLTKKTPDSRHKAGTTITLTDVVIAGIRKDGPDLGPSHLEELTYSYRTILVQNADGSTSTNDDVTANNQ